MSVWIGVFAGTSVVGGVTRLNGETPIRFTFRVIVVVVLGVASYPAAWTQ